MLRSVLRRAAAAAASRRQDPSPILPASSTLFPYSTKAKAKAKSPTSNRGKVRAKDPRSVSSSPSDESHSAAPSDDINSVFEIPKDPLPVTYDPALDVGPGSRPLFCFAKSFAPLTRKDADTYIDLSLDEWNAILPEGLPQGLTKEFEETRRCAVMIRQGFLDLRDNFRWIVDPPSRASKKGKIFVNAFRSMIHDDMMVGAFSHSTAVGKLRQELPDVPLDARVMLPRYTLDEAATVCHYYLRQRLVRRENFSDEKWKRIYYLSNGNGSEMRWLAPFI